MFSDFKLNLSTKLPYEGLQIKFDLGNGLPTFQEFSVMLSDSNRNLSIKVTD